jgi:hypothetical protein
MPQPIEQEAEVVSDGAHGGVDLIAEASFEEIAAQMTICFAVTDDRFDGGASPQLFLDLAVNAALLPGYIDFWFFEAVPFVPPVDIDPFDDAARQRLGFFDGFFQGVAVIRIAGQSVSGLVRWQSAAVSALLYQRSLILTHLTDF